MKLIIDISEEDYKECKFRNDLLSLGGKPTDLTFNMRMETLIAEGTPLQTELEEIKAEAEELIEHCDSDYDFEEIYGIKLVVGIIDNHINKADCDNDCEHCTWTECPKE